MTSQSSTRQRESQTRPRDTTTQTELANDIMGRNALQGDDQANVRNERHAVPDAKLEPDADPVESAKMLDKDERALAELSKGARSGRREDR